jgi:MoaA/NifB/PqqE/SkfB family radical SAM enzyme
VRLSGLHILLTYRCTFECDHCFVWGSPRQTGVFTGEQITRVLRQAREAEIPWIYLEGGEPFLYYALLVEAAKQASGMGFSVGIVTNAYWAVSIADAKTALEPFAGRVADLTVSNDQFHYGSVPGIEPQNVIAAAQSLNIPTCVISIAQPAAEALQSRGQVSDGAAVMFRGRAAKALAPTLATRPWGSLTECPHENLRDPGRVHLDPLGNVHLCQGVIIGNLFERPLKEICDTYDAAAHPICGPLLDGGPAALVSEYGLPHEAHYADGCHLCYQARLALRTRLPQILAPDQMYGVEK